MAASSKDHSNFTLKIVKNRTNTNKTKQERLKTEYIIPLHNIKYNKDTIPFLRDILTIHKQGNSVESILFAISVDLLGVRLQEYKHFDNGLRITVPAAVKREVDLMGSVYQYLTPKNIRLSKGSFYTSNSMSEDIVSGLDIKPTDTIFDPAIGSGSLVLNSKIVNPEQIVGVDLDALAIMCCKINYYLKFGNNAPKPKIYHADFCEFILHNKTKFDYVLCNPPYGATLDVSCLANSCVSTEDSLTYFVIYATPLAKKQAVFILPESVLNVKKHTALRKWVLCHTNLQNIKSYGPSFSGTMFPIITLTISNGTPASKFKYDDSIVKIKTIEKIPFCYFRPINSKQEELVQKVFAKKTQSLLGSVFGLGIVTGDNKSKVFSEHKKNSEPVITGKDITKFKIAKPKKYIIYDRRNLQQVAPDKLYRSKEKIIYKTVSRNMIFALDTTGALTLNSANFFIPKNLTISAKCLVALLNSDLYEALNKLLYGENKISRTNLENLPLPDIDVATQKQIERLVDAEKYDKINQIINSIFDL